MAVLLAGSYTFVVVPVYTLAGVAAFGCVVHIYFSCSEYWGFYTLVSVLSDAFLAPGSTNFAVLLGIPNRTACNTPSACGVVPGIKPSCLHGRLFASELALAS